MWVYGFLLNCSLQVQSNLWKLGGSCIKTNCLSHVCITPITHSLRAPPSQDGLPHRDIENCTYCFRKDDQTSSGLIHQIGLIVFCDWNDTDDFFNEASCMTTLFLFIRRREYVRWDSVENRYHYTPSKNHNCLYPKIISPRYNCTIPQIPFIIRLIMWQKVGLACANVNRSQNCSLGEIAANYVAKGGFTINFPLQGKPNLWELGGYCIMKIFPSHVFAHLLRAPPSRVVLVHRDIEKCTCCLRKDNYRSSGLIHRSSQRP